MILALDILKCIKYIWPTETPKVLLFQLSTCKIPILMGHFESYWPLICAHTSFCWCFLQVQLLRAMSSSLSGGHPDVSLMDMLASELHLSCPFTPPDWRKWFSRLCLRATETQKHLRFAGWALCDLARNGFIESLPGWWALPEPRAWALSGCEECL